MKLTPMTHLEHVGPYLLGTYEFQLHPWFASLSNRSFAQILDVGAKFGYYAVGLARLFPDTQVIAFDGDWWARAACREMASANQTSNLIVDGFCSPRWLDRKLQPASLIVCDCEGYEAELLLQSTSPALDSATLIIETHDEIVPGTTDAICRRFAGSHHLSRVSTTDTIDDPAPPVDLSFLTPDEAHSALREVRDRQDWLFLTPTDGVTR
ncbi:MAG: hypothetical protein ACYC61_06920 [Isosphaeraceae bacterium]